MMLPAHTAEAPGEECGSMMQAAELAVLDWIQAHLRCDFLDTVMPVSYTHLTLPTILLV